MPTDAESPKPTNLRNPYSNFRFRLKWKGKYVAGVSKVSGLMHPTQGMTHRSGGDLSTPRRMPGQSEYEAITLERGVTHDSEFEQWAYKVWDYHKTTIDDDQTNVGNQDVSLKDFREDIILDVYNESGQRVISYKIHRCRASAFTAISELDTNSNAVAIQTLTLENEGWERDTSVDEPTESSFTLPAVQP